MSDWYSRLLHWLTVLKFVALGVAVYLLITGIYSAYRNAGIVKHGIRVDAKYVSSDERYPWYEWLRGRHGRYRTRHLVHYVTLEYGSPDGNAKHQQEFEVSHGRSWNIAQGGKVQVTFREDDPTAAFVDDVDPYDPSPFVAAGILIAIFIGVAVLEHREFRYI
jgi:hypothetical protein